jgi:hypothetical protein
MRYLPLLLLASCSTAPDYGQIARDVMQALDAPIAAGAMLEPATGDANFVAAHVASQVEVIQAATSCKLRKPWLKPSITHSAACIAGREFLAVFNRGYTHTPGPKRPAWLLVSAKPATNPVDLSLLGFDGCWLMLDKPTALAPDGVALVNDRHRLTLRWVPPHALTGATFYTQAVWIEPDANDRHALFSDALRLRVGSYVETPPKDWAAWWAGR